MGKFPLTIKSRNRNKAKGDGLSYGERFEAVAREENVSKGLPNLDNCYLCGFPLKDHVETKVVSNDKTQCRVQVEVDLSKWKWVAGSEKK